MKTRIFALVLCLCLCLSACGSTSSAPAATAAPTAEPTAAPTAEPAPTEAPAEPLRIAGMKGPTTMGLVNLLKESGDEYDFQMFGAADEIVPLLVKGELDAAAVPANLAATLYKKTEGALQVLAVNTLGVLYVVETGETIQSVQDLKGRTIVSTGKGTTPEYAIRYILTQNGLDPDKDVTLEFCSEATEASARLAAAENDAVAVLPQPFVTSVLLQNEKARIALDMTEEWAKVSEHRMITGVMVARREVAEARAADIDAFLAAYAESAAKAVNDVPGTAALCEEYGIVAKAPVAAKALPYCNIVLETGEEMKADLVSYYQVLFDADPASVGGALPADDFYYGA